MTTTMTHTGAVLHDFIRHRMTTDGRLYAVVDAARDRPLAYSARDEFGLEIQWLFQGDTPGSPRGRTGGATPLATFEENFARQSQARMADFAPYVVPVPMARRYAYPDCGFLDRFAQRLGGSVGILLLTDVDLDPLARHLRTVFYATGEEDRRFYFRFYDPRVLRPFFPTCTAAEAREFFGPIDRVLVESEKTGGMCACQPAPSGVAVKENILGASAESRSPGERGR